MSRYSFKNAYEVWLAVNQFLPNPDIVLRKRNMGISVYRELLSDPHLTAALDSREAASLCQEWELERNECPARLYTAIEKWFYSIIEQKANVQDLSRDEMMDNLLDVIYWGYQPTELVWGFAYGHWLPLQIIPKPPEWFTWYLTPEGEPELRFLSVEHIAEGEPPPDPWTLICPRVKPTYENPYGRGVASRCFWPIVFKRAGIEFWMNFMERFGTPWVKGGIEQNAQPADVTAFKNDLIGLVQDAVVVLKGEGRTVELLETKNQANTADGFNNMLDFWDSQMSKTILGHTLSTDAGDKGSYAATRGALTVRDDIALADTKMLKGTFNDVINMICLRNGYIDVPRPKLRAYREAVAEVERANRDEALSRAGVRFSKKYFVRAYKLRDDDITKIADPNPQTSKDPEKEKSTTPGGLKNAKAKSGGNEK